jgi:NAD(P)-dependent dehydrogenase (short-subunit alcohol dehydrogenase family)
MMLEGKVAMITGAGAGIGVEIAKRYVKEGAKVCLTGRRQNKLDETVAMLPPGTAVTCVGDVSKLEDAKRMVEATVAFGGKIDILVNNAAIDPGGSVVDLDPDVWHAVIETNLTGPFYTMKCAIPHMIENGGGAIINISSLASVRVIPTMAPYCASKAGLNHLTNQVALDFGKHGIRAVSVLPGPVRTEMSEHSLGGMADAMGCDMDGVFQKLTCTLPVERVSHPREIAGVVAFLGSDDASFITAETILVDGGASMVDPCGASLKMSGAAGWGADMR